MGTYTGLRGSIRLNQSGVAQNLNKAINEGADSIWKSVYKNTGNPIIREWCKQGRCDFIPRGAVHYMPDEWGDNHYSCQDGVFNFTCSLKNYSGEIEFFIENIIPLISEDYYLERLFEEYYDYDQATEIIQEGDIEALMF